MNVSYPQLISARLKHKVDKYERYVSIFKMCYLRKRRLGPTGCMRCHYYRPQTKFAKVMFTGVCLSMGGVHGRGCACQGACMVGGHAWQGCVAGGMCGRGCVWWGGHAWWGHAWQGVYMGWGHVWQGGMHGRGHVWQGACVAGGACVHSV